MAMLAWNVRGLGNKETVRALKNTIFKNKAEIIFLSETKQKKQYMEKIRSKMKTGNAFYVEPDGIVGGLALWWSNNAKLSVLRYEKNFIDTKISINGEPEWFGTFIYAPPYTEDKQKFWGTLASLRNDINAKWCVIGDFNVVASLKEKCGGNLFDHNSAKWYFEFLDQTYLMEIPSSGGSFTWSNQQSNDEAILEKLDRVLSSLEWNFVFPKAISIIDIAIVSDHSPIVLMTNGVDKKAKRDFKFESRWQMEEECPQMVKEEWENTDNGPSRGTFRVKLRRTRVKLSKWNREKFGSSKRLAQNIMNQIKELQDKPLSFEEAMKLMELKAEVSKLWESEEIYWHQRSRVDWLKYGDRNSKFFHATTLQNRRRNTICRIKNEQGEWLEDDNCWD
ncbi:hypothetical protein GQ457_06G009460 [Hibiscus cannabinus]